MTIKEIQDLIKSGEGINIEFKENRDAINKDVYQTICAFLNRCGGHILLGVNDKGEITGVNPNAITKIKKELVSSANNPQKINPPVYLIVEDIKIEGKIVIIIYIAESSQVHHCNDRIYDRNEDGDFDITHHSDAATTLYMRKQSNFSENKVFPYLSMAEFKENLFVLVRKIIKIRNPEHPWLLMSNEDMLKSAGFYQKDYIKGSEGFTLGAALLFGRDDVIRSVIPYYKTDAILRQKNLDRYDDREIVETNLIESFDILINFIAKHLPDPFFIEGNIRISLREKIFREVVSNILIHREYLNPFHAKMIIEKDRVITENANKAHGFGQIDPINFSPFPKNPKIARFFREIGRADELGSGVKNIFKYVPLFSQGRKPELVEGDIFKIIIPLTNLSVQPSVEKSSQKTDKLVDKLVEKLVEKVGRKLTNNQISIVKLIIENKYISKREISNKIGISSTAVDKNISKLKQEKIIIRVGPAKGGHWEVIE